MSASWIGPTLLCAGLAVVSFAAAAMVVLAIARVGPVLRREPRWWPEFERAFADYVRTGAGRPS